MNPQIYATLVGVGIALAIAAVVGILFVTVFATKTPKSDQWLVDAAWAWVEDYTGLSSRTGPPGVKFRDGNWTNRGVLVDGTYKYKSLLGRVLWERVEVTTIVRQKWAVTVHELFHAMRRRNGLKVTESGAKIAMEWARASDPRT